MAKGAETSAEASAALFWPADGVVVPPLKVLDVEWVGLGGRGGAAMARHQGERELELGEGWSGEEKGSWDRGRGGDCAVLLLDGVVQDRACGGAGVVDLGGAAPGWHSISALPVVVGGAGGKDKGVGRDPKASMRVSSVWVGDAGRAGRGPRSGGHGFWGERMGR